MIEYVPKNNSLGYEFQKTLHSVFKDRYNAGIGSLCTFLESNHGCKRIISIDDITKQLSLKGECPIVYITPGEDDDNDDKPVISMISTTITELSTYMSDLGVHLAKKNTITTYHYLKHFSKEKGIITLDSAHHADSTACFTFGQYIIDTGLFYFSSPGFVEFHNEVLAQPKYDLIERTIPLSSLDILHK
jgi:hypothetical protein